MSFNRVRDFGKHLELYPATTTDGVQVPVPHDGDVKVDAQVAFAKDLLDKVNAESLGATFSATAGAANTTAVAISFTDHTGTTLEETTWFELWLSDNATGAGVAAAAPNTSATVTGGVEVTEYVTDVAWLVQAPADGNFELTLVDTAKQQLYVCIKHPVTGRTVVLGQLQTADYGS
jgi:hypothetical protein